MYHLYVFWHCLPHTYIHTRAQPCITYILLYASIVYIYENHAFNIHSPSQRHTHTPCFPILCVYTRILCVSLCLQFFSVLFSVFHFSFASTHMTWLLPPIYFHIFLLFLLMHRRIVVFLCKWLSFRFIFNHSPRHIISCMLFYLLYLFCAFYFLFSFFLLLLLRQLCSTHIMSSTTQHNPYP